MNKNSLIRKFNKQAPIYERNTRQRRLGEWRRRLLQGVEGKVLEVAVGAGANFPFYHPDTVDVTAVDFSPEMLTRARQMASELGIRATFLERDIETLELPERSYDCVVSTLSLCGYEDPVKALNNINRWAKPGGRIYLLEHGMSTNRLLGAVQHLVNPAARRISGCHYNRDMIDIVNASELNIVKTERYWNGIIHLIWAQAT
ncbi:class I SAM-dependent methyltransferase [Paenibacillus lautus]|uniref:Class I SAM-dependent methyltransferase n=1 Tax=Paenibacillus lautus TaxID=1401 RepID=A0A385TVF2_PAELA|nr:class I SAM-dependent methyltransferase [Paenibacillus lautus]AYB46492.1 class I SAM-dependent methyltransferase [Paenibacillus lautus]MCI1772428.1 class I SAM-dependent methyltransferase [Paenibacillus lautus]